MCAPVDSLLAETAINNGGAAMRCGLYNGCDLTRREGLDKVLAIIREKRPRLGWFSPDFGPFSIAQNGNQGTAAQSGALRMKQARARIMLKSCTICMKEILKYGGEIAGEQPGTCGSWRDTWSGMKEQLHAIKLHGCAIGLKDPKSG